MAEQTLKQLGTIADTDIEIVHKPEEVPSIFMDGAQGFFVVNGIAKINVFQIAQQLVGKDKPAEVRKIITAQLIMTPGVMESFARWLAERGKDLEESLRKEAEEASKSSDGK